VIHGVPDYKEGQWSKRWYGMKRFFEYLESKAYKMHIRVLLSKYRSYTPCETCGGARLKTESLLWRIGSKEDADAVLRPAARFMPAGVGWTRAQLEALPGLCLHDLMLLPIERLRRFFDGMMDLAPAARAPTPTRERRRSSCCTRRSTPACATCATWASATSRWTARAARSVGGEVQRINLTTALGTSLVNTLFVLDEPSIGLHPRDMDRITEAMQAPARRRQHAGGGGARPGRDAGGRPHDRHGPRPRRAGGQIVFDGTPEDAARPTP
jgi:excinuclease ABC subunit A